MLNKNTISIHRKHTPVEEALDFYLFFGRDGYIEIDALNQFLDYRNDFKFEMDFQIKDFIPGEIYCLMNSCKDISNNKIGIGLDGGKLYVQAVRDSSEKTELYIPFSDTGSWHTIKITNNRGEMSAILDKNPLSNNSSPLLSLPDYLGFKIASNTKHLNRLYGSVDNILLTDLRDPIAQYPLITGHGIIAYDSVGHYNGTISNGSWMVRL